MQKQSFYGKFPETLHRFNCLSVVELYEKANLKGFVGLNALHGYLKPSAYAPISEAMKQNIDFLLNEALKRMEDAV